MKSKLMIASLLLAGACAANLNAQEKTNYYTPKWSDNIFVSVGGGIHAINNDGFNKIAPHFSVSVGKLITPTWGARSARCALRRSTARRTACRCTTSRTSCGG